MDSHIFCQQYPFPRMVFLLPCGKVTQMVSVRTGQIMSVHAIEIADCTGWYGLVIDEVFLLENQQTRGKCWYLLLSEDIHTILRSCLPHPCICVCGCEAWRDGCVVGSPTHGCILWNRLDCSIAAQRCDCHAHQDRYWPFDCKGGMAGLLTVSLFTQPSQCRSCRAYSLGASGILCHRAILSLESLS